MAQIIDGKQLAQEHLLLLKEKMQTLSVCPGIAAILIGDNEASRVYVALKEKRCTELGIHFEKSIYDALTPIENIIAYIQQLNARTDIHAILIQLPLPKEFDTNRIIKEIEPRKDVDGFHPENIQRFMTNTQPYIRPVLIRAILALIAATHEPLRNKKAVILGKSDVFMRPLGSALLRLGMQVMWQTITMPSWHEHAKQADVLITALGMPHIITKNDVKKDAIAIDIGITKKEGQLLGDLSPEVQEQTKWITPVPGGVGPMTVAMLLENVVEMAQQQSA